MAWTPRELVDRFRQHFSSDATPSIYRAPGRVNLIGEHTDYNSGLVFPIALDMACYVAVAPGADNTNGGDTIRLHSSNFKEVKDLSISGLSAAQPEGKWYDYVTGVAKLLQEAGYELKPSSLYIHTEVPVGSGLSSSAALEVSSALALLSDRDIDKLELAKLCQRAESEFVGMPCGIMDQYASVFGQAGSAICIDCRDLTSEPVSLPANVQIVAVNSMVKHELGTSAYRDRVAECRQAVEAIQSSRAEVKTLRDVSAVLFAQIQDSIPTLPRKRARHIVTENERVSDSAAAARSGNLAELGRLFIASHRSMQYDYEISCDEIDFLVDTAVKVKGVYGSRMTGGGFGGCTVNLVAPEVRAQFEHALTAAYRERFDITPVYYDCEPAPGASRIASEPR